MSSLKGQLARILEIRRRQSRIWMLWLLKEVHAGFLSLLFFFSAESGFG